MTQNKINKKKAYYNLTILLMKNACVDPLEDWLKHQERLKQLKEEYKQFLIDNERSIN